VLSVPEVYRLAGAIEPRYRALVLLATFGNLRWGELAGLRRRNLDLDKRCVRVTETVYEFGQLVKGTPKSRTSIRTVVLPELIVPELRRHLDTFAGDGPDGFVFVGVKGGQLRRSNFSKLWARALAKAELPAVHVHDLRHTGNTLTGKAGASLAELMNRMGHSSTRAARVYLHAREERDRQLASTLDKMARRELRRSSSARNAGQSDATGARVSQGTATGEATMMAGKRPELGKHSLKRVTVSSLRTCEWGGSRHRNSWAGTVGGCRRRALSSPLPSLRAGPRVRWPGPMACPRDGCRGWWPSTGPRARRRSSRVRGARRAHRGPSRRPRPP
jgi:integrase-like protein